MKEIIDSAFEDEVKLLFKVLVDSYILAKTDEDKLNAEHRFKEGVNLLKEVKNKAMVLVA